MVLEVLRMEYWTTAQAAEHWGIKVRRVQTLCENGQIPVATRIAHMWVIPVGTEKPIDGRTKAAREQAKEKKDL
jgi:hypothetical protein